MAEHTPGRQLAPKCLVAMGLELAEVGVGTACEGPGAVSGQWPLAWAVPHIHTSAHTHIHTRKELCSLGPLSFHLLCSGKCGNRKSLRLST